MTAQDRVALNIGRLVVAIEEKQAIIDDLMKKITEQGLQIVELEEKLKKYTVPSVYPALGPNFHEGQVPGPTGE